MITAAADVRGVTTVLPTFVIGLREGLEAALIVGIVAAFLVQEGRRDAMKWVWAGVGLGVLVALGVGIGLRVASQELPQREQEQLETIVALVAVGMVTWMILWMRRHAADLKGDLRSKTGAALATGSTAALVAMAFLAVIREGFETAVFLVAVFNDASDPQAAGLGAVLGIAVAVVIGYLVYRGGVKINLAKFFKFTGLVLVIVAAGLLSNAVHTAHEAGWWNTMLGQAADLSSVVKPGSVRYAIFNGMFGIQSKPTWGEAMVWFLYAIPMTVVVLMPPRKKKSEASGAPRSAKTATRVGAGAVTVALVLGLLAVGAGAATKEVKIELTDKGCPKQLTVPAGETKFEIENLDANVVTEFEVLDGKKVIGEKENLTPGLSGSFTVDLQPGRYTTLCPNGDREKGVLVVTGKGAKTAAAESATKVKVTLGEFVVQAKPKTAPAGRVDFVVTNKGSMTHEFVVAKAGADGTLPVGADGTVDEAQIPESDFLGELEDMERGDKATLDVTMTPGTYVLFCNITEESGGVTDHHYVDGMHTTFTVK
ncbi:MAG: iron uptake transporter permease EfeU [Acidimicrobiia bacterium]